jgi:hypothetical protein
MTSVVSCCMHVYYGMYSTRVAIVDSRLQSSSMHYEYFREHWACSSVKFPVKTSTTQLEFLTPEALLRAQKLCLLANLTGHVLLMNSNSVEVTEGSNRKLGMPQEE